MLDDIRARLKGGIYDPLVAADVSLLLAEIERQAADVDELRKVCGSALAFWDRYIDRTGPNMPWAVAVRDRLRAALED